MTLLLERGHNAHFVHRGDARVNARPFDAVAQFFLVHVSEFTATDAGAVVATKFAGDGFSGSLLITGDHLHVDTCAVATRNGIRDLCAGRIDDTH